MRYRKPKLDGDTLRAQGLAIPLCWLPDYQEPHEFGPMPGRAEKGQWSDGPSKWKEPVADGDSKEELPGDKEKEAEKESAYWKKAKPVPMSDGPRDVRRGDHWLDWHSED